MATRRSDRQGCADRRRPVTLLDEAIQVGISWQSDSITPLFPVFAGRLYDQPRAPRPGGRGRTTARAPGAADRRTSPPLRSPPNRPGAPRSVRPTPGPFACRVKPGSWPVRGAEWPPKAAVTALCPVISNHHCQRNPCGGDRGLSDRDRSWQLHQLRDLHGRLSSEPGHVPSAGAGSRGFTRSRADSVADGASDPGRRVRRLHDLRP